PPVRLRRYRLESTERGRDVEKAGYDRRDGESGLELTFRANRSAISFHRAQPFLVHVHPDRILIVAGRYFAEIEANRVERVMGAAVIADVFENAVHRADDAAFAADVARRARVAGGIFDGDHHGVADFVLTARGAHNRPQSGRTRGISGSTCAASRARCSLGSSA